MRILVTGGAGYIGSIVTEQLAEAGHEVIVYDNLSQGHAEAVHPDAVFIRGDLADRPAVRQVFDIFRIDAVMHFASNTLIPESVSSPLKYLGDNVVNGFNLFRAMAEHGVKRLVLSSTANLFGSAERMPIEEGERIVPGSPYGESKYLLERVLSWLDRTSGLRYAALRYFNAAGASERYGEHHSPETHLIPIALQVALGQREKLTICGTDYPTGDGTCVRDYFHVIDLAQAHILSLAALDEGSRVYNLGNGCGYSVRQVIEVVREVTGHPIPVEIGPRRPGDPAVLVASSERIRRELHWRPRYPHLRQIVESAWEWHSRYPLGYGQRAPVLSACGCERLDGRAAIVGG